MENLCCLTPVGKAASTLILFSHFFVIANKARERTNKDCCCCYCILVPWPPSALVHHLAFSSFLFPILWLFVPGSFWFLLKPTKTKATATQDRWSLVAGVYWHDATTWLRHSPSEVEWWTRINQRRVSVPLVLVPQKRFLLMVGSKGSLYYIEPLRESLVHGEIK